MTELKRYSCITCGAPLKEQDGKFVCANCKNEYHLEEKISEEEVVALNRATTDRNLLRFDDAFEEYDLLLKKYPKNEMANWGAFLSFYGIVYEQDLDGKYIPTCHRLSEKPVESSKYYYLFNDEHKRRAQEIEKLRVSIWKKAQRIPPYDVFICYKATEERFGRPYPTKEASWARDVYEMLTHELKLRVFFAEKSLGDSNEEYEPHIYSALNSAKLMFVMTTGIENVNAVWVKNEWKRYSKYIQEGQKKTLRVVYDNIEPYDLPLELQKTQAINHNEMDWGAKVKKAAQAIFIDPLEEERKKKEAEEKARKAREEAEARERVREEELQKMREAMEALKRQANAPKTVPAPAPTPAPTVTAPVRRGESADKYCAKCGAGNVKNTKFCAECGHNVFAPEFKQYCLECGTETELLKKFCPNCGKNNFGFKKDAYAKEQERRNFDIVKGVLKKYKGKATKVIIPDSVTSIGDDAFSGCESLTSITIPDSVTSIGWNAFKNCKALTNITIPDGVTSIGAYAFTNCSSLTSIAIPNGVKYIETEMFSYCVALTSITIPDSVTGIDRFAFANCKSLTSITIPDGVTSIGLAAFQDCKSLTRITIPNGVTSISPQTFNNCDGLTRITIPNSVTSIGKFAFSNCKSLTSITIPDSVTRIDDAAFENCKSLKNVKCSFDVYKYLPKKMLQTLEITSGDRITERAFVGCGALVSVTIGKGVTNVRDFAFNGCNKLTDIIVDESNANYKSMDGNLYSKDGKTLLQYACGKKEHDFAVPDGVVNINKGAFEGCRSLKNLTVANSVKHIGNSAFANSGLTSVTLGNQVESIGLSMFQDCKSLASVTIPDSVTSIAYQAFSGCSNLKGITIPDSVTIVENAVFEKCDNLKYVKCPAVVCKHLPKKSLQKVTITSGEIITERAFESCENLMDVVLPNSLTTIKDSAFYQCGSLKEIIIPESVTVIEENAFEACNSLTIYAYAEKKPKGWHEKRGFLGIGVTESWNSDNRPVVWGYKGK